MPWSMAIWKECERCDSDIELWSKKDYYRTRRSSATHHPNNWTLKLSELGGARECNQNKPQIRRKIPTTRADKYAQR